MTKIQKKKLVFVETTDNAEMNLALHNYRKVCILPITRTMSIKPFKVWRYGCIN